MNELPPSPQRKVSLRLSSGDHAAAPLAPEALERLLARAHELGLPLHRDPQVAALLAALRMRDDVPPTLYAAAAAVLSCVYDAATSAD
ncbi:flagellar biosynthesis protein [Dyella silvatica]|uniref:flagellar biosynthesis protein n=1 Tax=Dyella silvatica TaxID=2992128 RepID=UPI00224ED03D|nr:flagellar biosynthesis protein [Dyella silvatica]